MMYEFIATISAGFALAGVALVISHIARLLFKVTAPKWLIPLCTAIGIFGFQIHQEYNWYRQMANTLPKEVTVVKTITASSWYRPWSYIKPQIVRFMAVEKKLNKSSKQGIAVNLYFFERRMSVKRVSQIIDCKGLRMAHYQGNTSKHIADNNWIALTKDDPIIKAVCN